MQRLLPPRRVVTWDKVERILLHQEIWNDPNSIVHRLPEHYKLRYWENLLRDHAPVNYRPPQQRYVYDKNYQIWREYEHHPIIPIYPPEADKGLWGGEGILKGYRRENRKKFYKWRNVEEWWPPKFWWPDLIKRYFYSEILDRYMVIMVTNRTLDLIDQNYGFDFYILKTPEPDLHSKLGCKLKREMLIALAKNDFHHNDSKKQKEVAEKYKEFKMSLEEAEWVGYDLNDACARLQDLEQETKPMPLKFVFEQELVQRLQKHEISVDGGGINGGNGVSSGIDWLKKILPASAGTKVER